MAKGQKKVAEGKSDIVKRIPRACHDERAAVEFLEEQRWQGVPVCPHCGDTDVYQMKDAKTGERNRRFLWRCHGCKRQFTVRIGTVFEDSRIPSRHWCLAFWLACASKKGVSAMQVKRLTGLSYKSTLFMMHRIRYAMAGPNLDTHLVGIVEADETYVGGKPRPGTGKHKPGRGTKKTPVVAIVERGGNARAAVIKKVTAKNLKREIDLCVDKEHSRLMTDEFQSYLPIGREFEGGHGRIRHSAGQYVDGDVHTNTAESFFALIKRGMYGTFHSVSKKHLHRYVAEFEFRWNSRKMDDGERTAKAIRAAEGKRLTYRQPSRS